jgi:site-specific recombinase XerD
METRHHSMTGSTALQAKLQDWPEVDQLQWAQATEAADILAPAGLAAKWTVATRKTVIKGYGRWLAWLEAERLLDRQESPAARSTPENVAAYIGHLRSKHASTTVWSYTHALAMALMVMEPSVTIEWLWQIERRLARVKTPVRRKVERLVSIKELYRFGLDLMADAGSKHDPGSVEGARVFRNGLMIALLAARPIRIRNLRSIAIGENLVKANARYYLVFQAHETKTRKPLEFEVPDELSSCIATYIATYRPILLGRRRPPAQAGENHAPGSALWVSQFGTAMKDFAIYTAISNLTRKRFGRHVNPHLFRDCAATSVALEDAAHVGIVPSILGHACMSTSERYYNHALSIRAMALHQAEILAARKAWTKLEKRPRISPGDGGGSS